MNIVNIPNITVSGETISPYSFDYSYGGSGVSEITLKFVNQDGKYRVPEVNSKKPVKIRVGNFKSFDAYVVETEVTNAVNGGSILTVKYFDSSIILDRLIIGLKGLHGTGFGTIITGTISPDIILVGTQVDPCKDIEEKASDPCAPACAEKGGKKESIDCAKERRIKILQVDYSFSELRGVLSSKVNFGNFPTAINENYRASYTGTLREVISSWCSDFGIGFFWESNSVYFYDLSLGVTINDSGLDTGTNVVNFSETKSIKNNSTKAKIVYFGAPGESRDYECTSSDSRVLDLKPITLYDLLSDTRPTGFSSKSPINTFIREYDSVNSSSSKGLQNFYTSIVLSYYSSKLRDLALFYEVLGFDTSSKVTAYISNKNSKPYAPLGNFRPRYVLTRDSVGSEYSAYSTLSNSIKDNHDFFIKSNGYFIVAEYIPDVQEVREKMETNLAENFIGKYWIRSFSQGGNYDYTTPDSESIKYLSNGSEIIFPFLKDLPDDFKRSSDFLQEVILSESSGSTTTSGKFVLMERTAAWTPAKNSKEMNSLLENFVEKCQIVNLGSDDVAKLGLSGVTDFENLCVFKVFPKPTFIDFTLTLGNDAIIRNPVDAKNTGKVTTVQDQTYSVGLKSALTDKLRISAKALSLTIFMPSQAGLRFGSQYAGYTVIAEGKNSTSKTTQVLEKKQVILADTSAFAEKDVSSSLNFKDASQNLIKFIEDSGTGTCGYSTAQIQALLLNLNSREKTFPSVEMVTRTYEISGIPTKSFSFTDGLQGFSISLGENGLHTSMTFSNLPAQRQSETLTNKKFEEYAAILGKAKTYFTK